MNTIESYQQDIQAISAITATLLSATPGTTELTMLIQDMLCTLRIEEALTAEAIRTLTEQELRPQFWQDAIDEFYSDGGVYLDEVA